MNHKKPTKEELEANALKALEEANALKDKEEDEAPQKDPQDDSETNETVSDEEVAPSESEEGNEEISKVEEEPSEDPIKTPKPIVKSPEQVAQELEEKKAKLKEQAKENIVLHSANEKFQESVTQAADMPAPTDEEMIEIYPNWEDMEEITQKMARNSEWSTRKINAITSVSQEFKDQKAWTAKVGEFLADPKSVIDTPLLDGKEEEFRKFALKPTRRGVDFEDLVKSFLYDVDKAKPTNRGSMLDTNSVKPKGSKDVTKLTPEQGRSLRENDYKKWVEYSKAGKIENSF